jgi:hypothetical protein
MVLQFYAWVSYKGRGASDFIGKLRTVYKYANNKARVEFDSEIAVYRGSKLHGHQNWVINTKAIRKVTKQGMRKKLLYIKNTYILNLLLNVVIVEIETLVSENKFSYACVKEVCRLWAQPCFDTFNQLLIIVEALWSQPVLQVGKQVVVAWSKIKAVRRVVRQLPTEMLQQCSSASSCHGGALHLMEVFHAFCSEWPYAVL